MVPTRVTQKKTDQLIVIVEDEPVLREILTKHMKDAGLRVRSAVDGEAGYALIKEAKPDLVLLDMLLPKMTGEQVLEKLHTDGSMANLPVIVISNSGQPVDIEKAISFGIRDYIIKVNFDPTEVLCKVGEVLERDDILHTYCNEWNRSWDFTKGYQGSIVEDTHLKAQAMDQKKNILIIEDDPFLQSILVDKLKEAGFSTYSAKDTASAKERLDSDQISMVLLDLILPGVDGFAFLEQLKQPASPHRDIPVVILSNLGQASEIDRALKLGALDFIVKANVAPGEIVDKVKELHEGGQKKDKGR